MKNTPSSTRRHSRLAAALCALLALVCALPGFCEEGASEDGLIPFGQEGDTFTEDDYAEGELPAGSEYDAAADLSGNYAPVTADMESADLVVGYVAPAGASLHPVMCSEWSLASVVQLVFESVVDLDASMKPTPMLADSWAQDGKTWTFKLRSGIQFHNGAELTAYDVVQSYQALSTSYVETPWSSRLAAIESMDVADIYSVTVQGTTAGMATLYAMNFPVMQYNTINDTMPRGSGPYWYIGRDINDTIRLEANPLWWRRQPLTHSILFKRYSDSGDAIEAIHTRRIDMLSSNSSRAAFSRKLADLASMDYTTNTYEVLIPNLNEKSMFSDIRARQAVMYAIDRGVISTNAYLDMAVQSEVPVPPSSWLYESQSAYYYYSPERALQLLYDLGWRDLTGDGVLNRVNGVRLIEPNITIITYNDSTNSIRENAANLIASYLRSVGISSTVYVRSRERVLQLIKERGFDLALVGFNLSEVPSLEPMFGRKGALNLNGFGSDEMQSYIEAARETSDEEELKAWYSRMQMYIVNHLPVLGIGYRTGTVLATRSLGGMSGLRNLDTFNGLEFVAPVQ